MRLEILGCSGGVGVSDHEPRAHGSDQACVSHPLPSRSCGFPAAAVRRHTGLALPETIATLKECMFNFKLWPDYSALPSSEQPYTVFAPLTIGQTVRRRLRHHTTARQIRRAGGWLPVYSGSASIVYSGDTTLCDAFWEALDTMENLSCLRIETTFF